MAICFEIKHQNNRSVGVGLEETGFFGSLKHRWDVPIAKDIDERVDAKSSEGPSALKDLLYMSDEETTAFQPNIRFNTDAACCERFI